MKVFTVIYNQKCVLHMTEYAKYFTKLIEIEVARIATTMYISFELLRDITNITENKDEIARVATTFSIRKIKLIAYIYIHFTLSLVEKSSMRLHLQANK